MRVAVKTAYTSLRIILVYECNANVVHFDGVQLFTASGQRISKTVGGTTYNYQYLGDQLVEMAWGTNRMHFTYDAVGPLSVNFNGTEYFYLKNAQGDVTGLVDSTGTKVVAYTYGPWGEAWGVSGTLASTLGAMNPLRYRGYVYDIETGLYYLNSRYYNPTWGRFINADGQLNDGIFGNNLFSYCLNNPVNMSDYEGNVPDWINKAAKWVKEKIIQPIKRIFSPNKKSNLPDNYMLYKEHQKKGTTNPSNRNTHEKGQARKNRDNRGEKGDARRKPNPNKRTPQKSTTEYGTLDRVSDILVMTSAAVAILALVVDDIFGGFLDDAAIAPQIAIIWDFARRIFN